MKTMTLRLDDHRAEALELLARAQGWSQNAAMNNALDQAITNASPRTRQRMRKIAQRRNDVAKEIL